MLKCTRRFLMASSDHGASSSVGSDPSWRYDVFLSFRGETRLGFTTHLREKLQDQGIERVFLDEEELQTFLIHQLQNTASLLLPFVYSTTISPVLETLLKHHKMLDAILTNEVGRKASIAQGSALMRVAAAVYSEIPSLKSMRETSLSNGLVSLHHAPIFGLICGLLGLDSSTAQRASCSSQ